LSRGEPAQAAQRDSAATLRAREEDESGFALENRYVGDGVFAGSFS